MIKLLELIEFYLKMVKNTTGGKMAKKYASKSRTDGNRRVRYAEQEGEMYGITTQMLGNGMFRVKCTDDIIRICVIRGKFSGKNKSAHRIRPGVWVLVGLYEWEAKDKAQKCDLLEVYNDNEKEKLLQTSTNFMALQKEENTLNNIDENAFDDVLFDSGNADDDNEFDEFMKGSSKESTKEEEFIISQAEVDAMDEHFVNIRKS